MFPTCGVCFNMYLVIVLPLTTWFRWRDVRFKDISKEKDKKQNALSKLSAREIELRTRIQHLQDPDSEVKKEGSVNDPVPSAPLKSTNHKLLNGNSKAKSATAAADNQKKNRKRKAPT